MRFKAATVGFIAYLFLLAPYGRAVQAWVEQYVAGPTAALLALITVAGVGVFSLRGSCSLVINGLLKILTAGILCLVISPFILFPVEWSHIAHYSILVILIINGFPVPLLTAFLIAGAVGFLDESLQALTPRRVFDLRDVLLNILGAAVGLSVHRITVESLQSFIGLIRVFRLKFSPREP